LEVSDVSGDVSPETCLAHLKLLAAFRNLKEDVGCTDGLFGIFDSRASFVKARDSSSTVSAEGDDMANYLSMLRQKRWVLFIGRAVDRYEAWWNTFPAKYLHEIDVEEKSPKYESFIDGAEPLLWDHSMLPPLGKFGQVTRTSCTPTDITFIRRPARVARSHA
jgi:hypothetical protein